MYLLGSIAASDEVSSDPCSTNSVGERTSAADSHARLILRAIIRSTESEREDGLCQTVRRNEVLEEWGRSGLCGRLEAEAENAARSVRDAIVRVSYVII